MTKRKTAEELVGRLGELPLYEDRTLYRWKEPADVESAEWAEWMAENDNTDFYE